VVLALLVRRGYRWARAAAWIWAAAVLLAVGIVVAGRPWDVLQVLTVISGLSVPGAVSVLLAVTSSEVVFEPASA
jgi:Mn2+/Fe2+ NRAMP family transporter